MNPKSRLQHKADKLWYLKYLRPACEVCGKKAVQVHHFYYKGSYGHLRYNKDNAISLCMSCHFILHHQDPKKIEIKIIEARGQKWYKRLQEQALNKPEGSYLTMDYYRDKIKELK